MRRILLPFALLAAGAASAQPTALPGADAVHALGTINGTALQCGLFDQTRRIKQAIIAHVPKQRAYGAVFEESTNAGFMAFMQEQRSCPTEATLAARVDAAIAELDRAFD